MFILIIQLITTLSIGGILLMMVRKAPQLVVLSESSSASNWRIGTRLFRIVKSPVVLIKRASYELKHAEKVDFRHEPVSQASKVDQERTYWTDIRRK